MDLLPKKIPGCSVTKLDQVVIDALDQVASAPAMLRVLILSCATKMRSRKRAYADDSRPPKEPDWRPKPHRARVAVTPALQLIPVHLLRRPQSRQHWYSAPLTLRHLKRTISCASSWTLMFSVHAMLKPTTAFLGCCLLFIRPPGFTQHLCYVWQPYRARCLQSLSSR